MLLDEGEAPFSTSVDDEENDSILSSTEGDAEPAFFPTPTAPSRASASAMGSKHARPGLLQRLRQKLSFGGAAAGAPPEEHAKLVTRAPKKRSLKRQSLINVPTEVVLRALANKMAAAGWEDAEQQLEELSTLLRLHLRQSLQEESLWLTDGFDQLSGELAGGSGWAVGQGLPHGAEGLQALQQV